MQILRNVFRRKLRVILTIFGITIGVFALVVMGSMAEKINLLVAGGTRYYSGKVTVAAAGSASLFSTQPLSLTKLAEIEQVPGVAAASAGIGTLLSTDSSSSSFMPATIQASDMRGQELESFKISYAQGRALTPADQGSVVVGADLVKKLSAKVGGFVTIRGEQFKVVGILNKTLTAPDTSAWMTLPDAQQIFVQDLPEMLRSQVNQQDLVTSFVVYPTKGTDAEQLAQTINQSVSGVKATGPSAFQEEVANQTKILNAILYGIALISLIVGGLSVINTMTMSVSERTREIGVRKSIGASDGQIVRQFLAEAGVIGLIGGVAGLVLGWLAAAVADALGQASGLALFLVTPRLAIGAVVFAVVLGLVSGLYPSLHAARLKPVVALRYE